MYADDNKDVIALNKSIWNGMCPVSAANSWLLGNARVDRTTSNIEHDYDPSSCHPPQPVHVLQIDGNADVYLGWTGPDYGMPFVAEAPGAVRTVQNWARLNDCRDPVMDTAPSLDLNMSAAGLDTTVLRFEQCPPRRRRRTMDGHRRSCSDRHVRAPCPTGRLAVGTFQTVRGEVVVLDFRQP